MNPDGTLNDSVPEKYRGLKMHTRPARRWSPTWKRRGCTIRRRSRRPRDRPAASDRSKTPIEPYLADQWFVKMGAEEHRQPKERRKFLMDIVKVSRIS